VFAVSVCRECFPDLRISVDKTVSNGDVEYCASPVAMISPLPASNSRLCPSLPIVGFLSADDPRMRATIDAMADRLTDEHGLVYRYRAEAGVDGLADGLASEERTFVLCRFWLAQALALSGQIGRAKAVFVRAVAFVNDVGLLVEEVDSNTEELLGNFPQAFSHSA
jgi:GH15 family glucan-1,4-alpha-glucosidase